METREVREVMEPSAGISLQENGILSSRQKLGHGQRDGVQVQSQELATSTHLKVWRKKGFIAEVETENQGATDSPSLSREKLK